MVPKSWGTLVKNQEDKMNPTTLTKTNSNQNMGTLYMALELSKKTWKLAFSDGGQRRPRVVSVSARDLEALKLEVTKAKKKFGLASEAAVRSCYEAGRDGFWIHRALTAIGIESLVVDPASIEVNRRTRQAKTDRLDAIKLVMQLVRHWRNEERVWSVVRVFEFRRLEMRTTVSYTAIWISSSLSVEPTSSGSNHCCLPKVST